MKRDKSLAHIQATPDVDLNNKKVVIIGGTGGIGRSIAQFLASRGADVLVVGQTFRDAGVPNITFLQADLSLMTEARRVAAQLPAETADLVVFTTGIMAGLKRETTKEGIERDLAVSYLNRFVILREVGPRLGKERPAGSAKPRVFVMAYPGSGHSAEIDDLNSEKKYSMLAAHMKTLAGNEVLVLDSARRYPHANFFGLNPGLVKTNIRRNLFGSNGFLHRFVERAIGFMMVSPETYVERIAPLLFSPVLEGRSGAMFDNKGRSILASPKSTERSYADGLTAASQALVARAGV